MSGTSIGETAPVQNPAGYLPATLVAHFLGLPILTWTVRTEAQRQQAKRWADQMVFEGFLA